MYGDCVHVSKDVRFTRYIPVSVLTVSCLAVPLFQDIASVLESAGCVFEELAKDSASQNWQPRATQFLTLLQVRKNAIASTIFVKLCAYRSFPIEVLSV